mmetsp:Transcript_113072/g.217757  ORF Transcript_113072/g.217757 Transcript_113072/m.217757 type:complete len:288 (-) Transcript_113072:3048-3911(-)
MMEFDILQSNFVDLQHHDLSPKVLSASNILTADHADVAGQQPHLGTNAHVLPALARQLLDEMAVLQALLDGQSCGVRFVVGRGTHQRQLFCLTKIFAIRVALYIHPIRGCYNNLRPSCPLCRLLAHDLEGGRCRDCSFSKLNPSLLNRLSVQFQVSCRHTNHFGAKDGDLEGVPIAKHLESQLVFERLSSSTNLHLATVDEDTLRFDVKIFPSHDESALHDPIANVHILVKLKSHIFWDVNDVCVLARWHTRWAPRGFLAEGAHFVQAGVVLVAFEVWNIFCGVDVG